MKKRIKLLLLIGFCKYSFAQTVNFEAKKIIVNNQVEGDAVLTEFDKKIRFQSNKYMLLEKNSPEQVFYDFFKISSQDQLKDFFQDGLPVSYSKEDYIKLMTVYQKKPEDNFYDLDFKVLLKDAKNESVYIKYINHNQVFPKPIASIIYLELINEKWNIKDLGDNLELGVFLSSIKGNVLKRIISNDLSLSEKKIIMPYVTNNKINFKKLSNDFFDFKRKNTNHPLVQLIYDKEYSVF
jgi:hypothetical protein